MTEKRFELNKDCEWWFVKDNTIKVNEFGFRDDLTGEDAYRGLKQELTEEETVELLNELHEKNNELRLQLNLCSDQRNEFHRGAIENANRVGKLEKENEHIKTTIKTMMENERTELGKSVLKQLYEAIQ